MFLLQYVFLSSVSTCVGRKMALLVSILPGKAGLNVWAVAVRLELKIDHCKCSAVSRRNVSRDKTSPSDFDRVLTFTTSV